MSLVFYGCLNSLLYVSLLPLWEGFDEWAHYARLQNVATTGRALASTTDRVSREVDVEVAFDGARPEQAAVDGVILSVADARSEVTRGCLRLAGLLEAKHGQVELPARSLVAELHPA